jgi:hypothetical protein
MPHAAEAHNNASLSTFISSYENGDYIADIVCPIIETDKKSNDYQKFLRKDVITPDDDLIGAEGEASESDYSQTTGTYLCKERGLRGFVGNSLIANADDPHKPFEKRSKHLMNKILLGREIRVATLLQTTTNYLAANTSAAGNVWTDTTNGTPLVDLHLMRSAIAPGFIEDTEVVLVLALEAWQALIRHPDMRGGGHVTATAQAEEIMQAVKIDRILVTEAQKNTANINQTATIARVWDATKAVMVRVPKSEPSDEAGLFAATFRWTRPTTGTPVGVRTWDWPDRGFGGGQGVQVELADAEVVVQNDMGYCLTAVTS